MKKISLKGLSMILSMNELKNVLGGSDPGLGGCNDSPCNCICQSDSNCWGDCSKCTKIANGVDYVCTQN